MIRNNAEGGTNGTTVSTANSGGSSGTAFNAIGSGTGTALTFDNTHVAHGTLAYKILVGTTSASSLLSWSTALTGSTVTQVWFRAYVYLTANPGSTLRVIRAMSTSTVRGAVAINSSGKVLLLNSVGTTIKTSTASVPLNQWFRLEGFIIGSATVGQLEVKLFTTSADAVTPDETQTSTAVQNTGGTINQIDYGNPASLTSYSLWMDELAADTTAYIGPVKLVTVAARSKKAVLSVTSHEKSVVTAVIALNKPRFSVTSHEKGVGSAAFRLKKPSLHVNVRQARFHHHTISWDSGEKLYSQGISNGVLYPKNSPGVPWNGLISVKESAGDKSSSLYMDGRRYRNKNVPGTFSGTIEAFTYPDEFEPYNGVIGAATGQLRPAFGFTYRSNREIHLVYNALTQPSSAEYQSIGSEVNPVSFSWDFSTLPVNIPGGRPCSHLVIDLNDSAAGAISALEDMLYGDAASDPFLPDPQTVYDMFDTFATVRIFDNGDGTWSALGPDDVITTSGDVITINWESAVFINDTTYRISSL